MEDCIFCKIVRGEIPCSKVYEDELVLSFLDINPFNHGHTLVITKKHYETLFDVPDEDLKACAVALRDIGRAVYEASGADGLNILQNNYRAAGQVVWHAHYHILPRYKRDGFITSWPTNPYGEGQMQEMLAKIRDKL